MSVCVLYGSSHLLQMTNVHFFFSDFFSIDLSANLKMNIEIGGCAATHAKISMARIAKKEYKKFFSDGHLQSGKRPIQLANATMTISNYFGLL